MSPQALRATVRWAGAMLLISCLMMPCSEGATLKTEEFLLDRLRQPTPDDTIQLRSLESGRYVGYSLRAPSSPAGKVAGVVSATHDRDSATSWFTACDLDGDTSPRLLATSNRAASGGKTEFPHRAYVVEFNRTQGAELLTQNSSKEASLLVNAYIAVQGWPKTDESATFSRLLVFHRLTSTWPHAVVAADKYGSMMLRDYYHEDNDYYVDPATLFIVNKLHSRNSMQEVACNGLRNA